MLQDAAALAGDLCVARAGEPPAQLVAPIAGEHDVRVRIDEARDDRARRARRRRSRPACSVDLHVRRQRRTDEDDDAL